MVETLAGSNVFQDYIFPSEHETSKLDDLLALRSANEDAAAGGQSWEQQQGLSFLLRIDFTIWLPCMSYDHDHTD